MSEIRITPDWRVILKTDEIKQGEEGNPGIECFRILKREYQFDGDIPSSPMKQSSSTL